MNMATPKPMTIELNVNDANFYSWRTEVYARIVNRFGAPGKSIMTGIQPVLTPFPQEPHKDDLDHSFVPPRLLYQRDGDISTLSELKQRNLELSNRGHQDLRDDVKEFRKTQIRQAEHDSSLLTLLTSSISEASKITINANPAYANFLAVDPLAGQSSWLYYAIIEATHKTGNFKTKLFRAQQFFTLSQGNSQHEEYMTSIRDAHLALVHDFGSKRHPGYIKIDDLTACIYLNGVDHACFATVIDEVVRKENTDGVPEPFKLMNDFQVYRVNKIISSVPAATAFSATAASPAKKSKAGKGKSPVDSTAQPKTSAAPGCKACLSYGRTYNATSHTFANCELNPNSSNFAKDKFETLEEARKAFLARCSKRAAMSPKPPTPAAAPRQLSHVAVDDPALAFIAAMSKMSWADREASVSLIADADENFAAAALASFSASMDD